MNQPGGESGEGARHSGLAVSMLRIGASLELETVLSEVAARVRELTGARYGAIAIIDEAGSPVDFVASGCTKEEHHNLVEWSEGPRLFEFFRELEEPPRGEGRRLSVHRR